MQREFKVENGKLTEIIITSDDDNFENIKNQIEIYQQQYETNISAIIKKEDYYEYQNYLNKYNIKLIPV